MGNINLKERLTPRHLWAILLLLSSGILSMFVGGCGSKQSTITVRPGKSIQAAIDATPAGAEILLPAGEWQENLTITKSLILRGEGADKTRIRAYQADAAVIGVDGRGEKGVEVVLAGLTLTGTVKSPGALFLVGDNAHVTVTQCTLSENAAGILLLGSSQATIALSTFSKNDFDGIVLGESSQAAITGCTVSENNRYGIYLVQSSQATITGCTISGNTDCGIVLMHSSQATIEDNTILNHNGYGIALMDSPCFFNTDFAFTGRVTGVGNKIPGPGKPDENKVSAVCPDGLAFLVTEEGGELDQRPQ